MNLWLQAHRHGGDDGCRMSREAHVRFCEGVGVKFPRATHPLILTLLALAGASRILNGTQTGVVIKDEDQEMELR